MSDAVLQCAMQCSSPGDIAPWSQQSTSGQASPGRSTPAKRSAEQGLSTQVSDQRIVKKKLVQRTLDNAYNIVSQGKLSGFLTAAFLRLIQSKQIYIANTSRICLSSIAWASFASTSSCMGLSPGSFLL